MGKKTTIQDVAAAARVSRAAVSLVLNNGYIRISDPKRKAILAAARRLGYTPHAMAQRLALRRMMALGLVFPFDPTALNQLYLFELTLHIASVARTRRYDLLIDFFHSSQPETLASDFSRTDGILLILNRDTPREVFQRIEKSGHPCIAIGGGFMSRQPKNFVDADVRSGTEAATRHLIDLGHREIAFLAGIPSEAKYEGYAAALRRHKLPLRRSLVCNCGLSESGIDHAIARLLAQNARPTALVATNDTLAIKVMQILHRRGLRVPADMSIVGFDDVEQARLTLPSLTTVRIPLVQIAQVAVNSLVDRLERKDDQRTRQILPVDLVVRESSGPRL